MRKKTFILIIILILVILSSVSVIYFIWGMNNSENNYILNDIIDNIVVNESTENNIEVQKENENVINENIEKVEQKNNKTTTSEKNENVTKVTTKEKEESQTVKNTKIESNTKEKKKETTKKAEDSKQSTENNKNDIKQNEKSIYDYQFDIEKIKSELIKIGEAIGLKHRTKDDGTLITPSNASWASPVTGSKNFQGKKLEKSLKDYVQSMPEVIESHGGTKIEYFTIYIENNGNGSYTFYFLY